MTPAHKQLLLERAEHWAEWVEKTAAGGTGYRAESCLADEVGSDGRNLGIDFVLFDVERCVRFDAAVAALPDHLRIVFKMHWLGSEAKQVSVATSAEVKAGHCGVSRATYWRMLDQAYEMLWWSS